MQETKRPLTLSLLDAAPQDSFSRAVYCYREVQRVADTLFDFDKKSAGEVGALTEQFQKVRPLVREFIKTAESMTEYTGHQIHKLVEYADQLKQLPLRLGKEVDENKEHVGSALHSALVLLLRDLVDDSDAAITDLTLRLRTRLDFIAGRPFEIAKAQSTADDFQRVVKLLCNSGGIERYAQLLELIRNHRSDLQHLLKSDEVALKAQVLRELWRSFDLVLAEEYFHPDGHRQDLIGAVLRNHETDESAKKVLFILTLLEHTHNDLATVEKKVHQNEYDEADRTVILRCLTYHMYSARLREYAAAKLDLKSLWTLLSFKRFPFFALATLSKRIVEKKNPDDEKLLFDLKYLDLADALGSLRRLDDTRGLEGFLVLFQRSEILLEDFYYDRFAFLVHALEQDQNEQSNSFMDLAAAVRKVNQTTSGIKLPRAESLDNVPVVTLSELAQRSMVYFRFFLTRPSLRFAKVAIREIRTSEHAASLLKMPQLSGQVVRLIAQKKGLMSTYQARKAVCFHPKANRESVSKHVASLRIADQRALARSSDANQEVRAYVSTIVKRRR